jgi:ABC-type sugar transport system ATPase subunit
MSQQQGSGASANADWGRTQSACSSHHRGQFTGVVAANTLLCKEHYRLTLRLGDFPPTYPGQFIQVACRNLELDYSPESEYVIQYNRISENAQHYVDAMHIKCSDLKQKTMNLSGGNQQKVLLSMWLSNGPEILLIDEPTRGVDVGAKAEIHGLLRGIVAKGKSVILVSSELPEILASCDRVMVMYEGKLMDTLENNADLTEERIIQLASGIN